MFDVLHHAAVWCSLRSFLAWNLCTWLRLLPVILLCGCIAPDRPLVNHFTEIHPGRIQMRAADPAPQPGPRLAWSHPSPGEVALYEIRSTTNLTLPLDAWPLVATTSSTSWSIPLDAPQRFFIIRAIGTNGLPSAWATD